MTGAGSGAALVGLPHDGSPAARARPSHDDATTATAAWLIAVPCAAIVIGLIALLGPPLGRLLFPRHGPYTFLAGSAIVAHPEPTEHARYLLALLAPLLLAWGTATPPRWLARVPARAARIAAIVAQALLAAVLIACVVVQDRLRYGFTYTYDETILTVHYFKPATLIIAAVVAVGTLIALRSAAVRGAATSLLHDSRTRHVRVAALAVAITAIWLLHAVQTDTSIATAPTDLRNHLEFTMDETFAVVNGLTPFVNFSAQYASLWPFVVAPLLAILGKTLLVFTLAMATIGGLALLAVFSVLRRVTRSSLAALLLYVPFVATTAFFLDGETDSPSTVATYFGTFPLRYAGPYFVAGLVAWQLERGQRTASTWALFTVAGLALLNNGDFGVAALGASLGAFLWTIDLRRAPLLRLAGVAGAGLVTALALVSALTLARAGSLPHLSRLLDYARLYSIGGLSMEPIRSTLGLHIVIYLTYVAAIGVATVRSLTHAPNRVLTGMLAWVGIFGLGAGAYWVGRSHPVALKSAFSAWAFALALLTVVVVQQLAAHPRRRPTIATVAVLFGFGVVLCSIGQLPTPWSQIRRLDATFVATEASPYKTPLEPAADPATRRFVTSLAQGPSQFVVKPGAPVAILLTNGHRIADAYGVRNVSPYTGATSLNTVQRVDAVIDALRKAGGNTMILPNPLDPAILDVLKRHGFKLLTHHGLDDYDPSREDELLLQRWLGTASMKWVPTSLLKAVDTHHLHPRALR